MRLIEIRDVQGNCLAVCDERCYNAGSPLCCCVCGGMNHGVGYATAAVHTYNHHDEWSMNFAKTLPPGKNIWTKIHDTLLEPLPSDFVA